MFQATTILIYLSLLAFYYDSLQNVLLLHLRFLVFEPCYIKPEFLKHFPHRIDNQGNKKDSYQTA